MIRERILWLILILMAGWIIADYFSTDSRADALREENARLEKQIRQAEDMAAAGLAEMAARLDAMDARQTILEEQAQIAAGRIAAAQRRQKETDEKINANNRDINALDDPALLERARATAARIAPQFDSR